MRKEHYLTQEALIKSFYDDGKLSLAEMNESLKILRAQYADVLDDLEHAV